MYIKRSAFKQQRAYKAKLCIDWLTKMLVLQALEKLPHYCPGNDAVFTNVMFVVLLQNRSTRNNEGWLLAPIATAIPICWLTVLMIYRCQIPYIPSILHLSQFFLLLLLCCYFAVVFIFTLVFDTESPISWHSDPPASTSGVLGLQICATSVSFRWCWG